MPAPKPTPWRTAALELRSEITAAADAITAARGVDGERVVRTDATWRVVETVARLRYRPSIADLGRALGTSRQTARTFVVAAARAGFVELQPNHDDRRLLEVLLTPRGRSALAAAEGDEVTWLMVLLNGLHVRDMATTSHVLTVIRQRLLRDARELARYKRNPLKSFQHTGDPTP